MRHCDESGNAERNRQMHEQLRIKWILNVQERANKNGNAQKPGNTTNCGSNPWQMNQSTARGRKSRRIDRGSRAKTVEPITKRADAAEPQKRADRVHREAVHGDGCRQRMLQ